MGYTTYCCIFWGLMAGVRWTKVHHYLSRAMENTTIIVLVCCQEMLIDPSMQDKLEGIKTLTRWTDGPNQFKRREWIGTFGYNVMEAWGMDMIHINYGAPKHFKSE